MEASGWIAYVKNLTDSTFCKDAAIIGPDGPPAWASTPNFTVGKNDFDHIAKCFKDSKLGFSQGVNVGGNYYIVVRLDDRSMYAKRSDNKGLTVVWTGKLYLFSTYEAPVAPGQNTLAVERLADYLRENGY